jgi:hypothetical protein
MQVAEGGCRAGRLHGRYSTPTMESRWLKCAHSYQVAEQLQSYTSYNKQQSGELTNRLEQLKRKLERRHPPELKGRSGPAAEA